MAKNLNLSESKIERSVCDNALKELGIENVKLGQDGMPDRMFLIPGGRPLFIEFKRAGLEAVARQNAIIEKMRAINYMAYVCDTEHEANMLIRSAILSAKVAQQKDVS